MEGIYMNLKILILLLTMIINQNTSCADTPSSAKKIVSKKRVNHFLESDDNFEIALSTTPTITTHSITSPEKRACHSANFKLDSTLIGSIFTPPALTGRAYNDANFFVETNIPADTLYTPKSSSNGFSPIPAPLSVILPVPRPSATPIPV